MQVTYEPTWDLEKIFPGGSESLDFQHYIRNIDEELEIFTKMIEDFDPKAEIDVPMFATIMEHLEKTLKKVSEASAFVSCLSAQNVKDDKANVLLGQRSMQIAKKKAIVTNLEQKLTAIDEGAWIELLEHPNLKEIAFVLNETREQAKRNLPTEQEVLLNDLAVDGYHAWNEMYGTIVGNMTVELEENGKVDTFSVGQADNKLSDPDRNVRRHVFEQIAKAFAAKRDLFGQTLNHLAGFRLQTYKHRNWTNVLKEPLELNRMKQETLDAMWRAIIDNKRQFVKYLEKKAELLGVDKLSIYDIEAPIADSVKNYTYTEGANFIIDNFEDFSPKMANFARHAFENRWIEAEDRAGKRPGGFCTSFPDSEQTRIFMTYSGTTSNISTLAHELGHAYHQHVMNDVNGLNQGYAMNVAETASTFAEMIVADASVKKAETKEEKLALLEEKIQRSVAFFMNIHARFIFETRFYEERKQGIVPVNRLNELMVDAQKEAYNHSLSDYDPNFWASKLHFHITGTPFYNFPYTFGYIFSLGIYAYAQEKGGSFEDDYIALLRDTGRMSVEDLAEKHLNVDLTKPDFWENAINLCVKDVEEFLAL